MRRLLWFLLSAALPGLLFVVASPRVWSADQSQAGQCQSPENHQWDFWVGDWDGFDFANQTTPVARVHLDRILDGCVLREDYQDANGNKGQSFSIYDAGRKVWHQSWVTNRGQLLLLDGGMQDGSMTLTAT